MRDEDQEEIDDLLDRLSELSPITAELLGRIRSGEAVHACAIRQDGDEQSCTLLSYGEISTSTMAVASIMFLRSMTVFVEDYKRGCSDPAAIAMCDKTLEVVRNAVAAIEVDLDMRTTQAPTTVEPKVSKH